jgi:hypothetical protein
MYWSPYRFVSLSNLRSFLLSFISLKFLSQPPAYQFAIKREGRNHHLDHTVHAVDAKARNSRCFVIKDRSLTDMLVAWPASFSTCSAVSMETLPSDHLNIRSMYSFDIASECVLFPPSAPDLCLIATRTSWTSAELAGLPSHLLCVSW